MDEIAEPTTQERIAALEEVIVAQTGMVAQLRDEIHAMSELIRSRDARVWTAIKRAFGVIRSEIEKE